MLFLKCIHSAGGCTRTQEEEYLTSDVMNSIESKVAYLWHFLQVLLGSIIKNTNAKIQVSEVRKKIDKLTFEV